MAFGDHIQSASASANSGTSVPVTISTAVSGNLLLCSHFTGNVNSVAPTGGFAEAIAVSNGGDGDQAAIYWKISDGTETTVTPTSDGSDEQMATVSEFEGPWESSPVDQTGTNDATSESATTVTTDGATSQADEIVYALVAARFQNLNFTWDSSFIERGEPTSSYKTLTVSSILLTATGTPSSTATQGGSARTQMGCIATFKKQAVVGGRIMSSLVRSGGLAAAGGIAGVGGGLAR